MTNNTSNAGTIVQTSVGISRNLKRDLKVPLKDIFGVGGAEEYSTDIFGETRIHLETNFNKLKSSALGGDEDTSLMFDATNNYGDMEGNAALADGTKIFPR